MQIKSYSSISELPAACADIFSAAAKSSIFNTKPWMENYIQTVVEQDNRDYSILSIEDSNNPKALLFVQEDTHGRNYQYGKRMSGLNNYYFSLWGPIVDEGDPGAANLVYELVKGFLNTHPGVDIVDFNPLDTAHPSYPSIIKAFKDCGWLTQQYFCFGNWYLPTQDVEFETYLSNRPSQLKNTLKRKRKKFDQEPGARIEIITGGDGLQSALDAFLLIYEKSWKEPEPYPNFLPGLVTTCAANGWLRLGVAWVGDKPAAAQVWMVDNGIASIFKLAYDPQFNKLSVGSLLTAALMEYVFKEDKVSTVDYLTGDDSYKKDWMTLRRERYGVIAFNPRTLPGLTSAIINIGGRTMKQVLQRFKKQG